MRDERPGRALGPEKHFIKTGLVDCLKSKTTDDKLPEDLLKMGMEEAILT